MPSIHLIMTLTIMIMVMTMPMILDIKMVLIAVINGGIVMVGLMMIFGAIGMQSVGGDCM